MGAEELVYFGDFLIQLALFILFLVIIGGLAGLLSSRKSQHYRKLVTDMYVAAKTRFLAKEDGLDLEAEEETYKAWVKKKEAKQSDFDLDRTIEQELKERVSEPVKKKK